MSEILMDDTEQTELLMGSSYQPIRTEDIAQDALKYLAGYVAFKCGTIDKTLSASQENYSVPCEETSDWISIILKGGLPRLSEEWLEKFVQFEIVFGAFHGETFSKRKNVMKTLASLIKSKFPEVHDKIINL